MEQEINELKRRIGILERNQGGVGYGEDDFSDRKVLRKTLELEDGKNISTGTSIGSSFGKSASQKISVYGKTPIVQQQFPNAPSTPSGTYVQSEAQSTVNAVNALITILRNFGITN